MTKELQTFSRWTAVKKDLHSMFPQDVYKAWFESIQALEETEDTLILGVANEFASIWIQDNYLDLLDKKLRSHAGKPVAITFKVTHSGKLSDALQVPDFKQVAKAAPAKTSEGKLCVLNPKNTFENFVVGAGNQLAHAACIAVSNAPAKAYNPLFLYGDTGLGKTHLMHAVAHHALKNDQHLNVVYISTEKFTNEFIHAIQENSLVKFRRRYRNSDILLIDDIHFLSGKERIQEEFFHTFNELFESQKQIFLCSDRPASEIAKLESRLVSRFQWGLVCDLQAPDFETRVAILSKKAAAMKLKLAPDVLNFLAERVTKNVRRMEGALTRLASYTSLLPGTINIATTEKILQDILQEEHQAQISLDQIQQKVCAFYHVTLSDLLGKRRQSTIVFPRQVAMYLGRMLTNLSLQEIGQTFGGRDHGTVIHACKSVENMMDQDTSVKRSVELLQRQITNNR
ncbi:MAG: chromosomal replication initiator DnaA [Verrucomicrobia bacterium GWC2_42_7]|nr:MAG: chromosomal replication initiator DnaA [Verrucomicrobia bacterium GWC2_42_7]